MRKRVFQMRAFQLNDDKNRIYFRNYERIPAETELSNVIADLKKFKCKIGERQELATDDIFECSYEGRKFSIVFTGEEAFIYSDDYTVITALMILFNK